MTDAAADLAYIRRLSEAGDRAPLLGGRYLAWWGALLSLAYFAHHWALARDPLGNGSVFLTIWGGFVLLGLLGHFVLSRSMPPMAGSGSAANRANRSVWFGAAAAIACCVAGAAGAAASGAGPSTFDWTIPVVFATYGCASSVTGALAYNRMVIAAGAGAMVTAGIFLALIMWPDRHLIAAIGAAVTVLLPGLLLLRAERPVGE